MAFNADILIIHPQTKSDTWTVPFLHGLKHALEKLNGKASVIVHSSGLANLSINISDFINDISVILVVQEEGGHLNTIFANDLNTCIESNYPKEKIIRIIKNNVRELSYPELLSATPFFLFYDIDPQSNMPRKYENRPGTEAAKLYWAKLVDLAYCLSNMLGPQKDKTKQQPQLSIYLAETTPDQYANYDELKRELIQRGHTVLPSHKLSNNIELAKVEINEALQQSALAIHIIGNSYGHKIKAADVSIIDLQQRLSAAYCFDNIEKLKNEKQTCFRLLYFPPKARIIDDVFKQFTEKLIHSNTVPLTEVLQSTTDEFKSFVVEKISLLNNFTENIKPEKDTVYIISDKKESGYTKAIADTLINNQINVIEIDYSKNDPMMQHRENLAAADGIIIFNRNNTEQWLSSKHNDIMKSVGYTKKEQFKAKAIITMNTGDVPALYKENGYLLIEDGNDYSRSLQPFLKKFEE
jgi:hypothetical protein